MSVYFHKHFTHAYKKLPRAIQKKFKERVALFLENEFHALLRNHTLRGAYGGCRSINVGGDIRAVYRRIDTASVLFITIGTNSKLYGR